MKSTSCILTLFFIGVCHQSFAFTRRPKPPHPKNCSQCTFEDTSTIPEIFQCSAKQIITPIDKSLLYDIERGLRSNCKIADPCRRVKSIESSHGKQFKRKEYDFIIVGAGVSGPILANRLSKNPKFNVLLLEAGPEEPIGPSVPYFFSSARKTKLDWQYETTKQSRACLRSVPNKPGVCEWPRGKMICGTFCMSGMMYTRGSPKIYNEWERKGNKGWNYEEVLKHFKKSESNKQNKKYVDKGYHGYKGPMPIANFPHLPKVGQVMLKAAEEVGFAIRDLNGRNQTGFASASVMTDNGIRASPSRMYLRPALCRPNLRVFIESFVTKIIFKGTKATAVEFVDKFNFTHRIYATKEIILSGGVIGSAQLLMLSGIGPKKDLAKLNIPVIKDLPVGKNLHHHVGVEGTATFNNMQDNEFNRKSLNAYLTDQTGPFSSTGLTQVSGFWSSTKAPQNIPDIQFFLDPYCSRDECRKYTKSWKNTTIAGMRSIYLISRCRGTIKLASKNPFDKPIINPNYLCNKTDVNAILQGIRKLQEILKASPFKKFYKSFGAVNESLCAYAAKDSDKYWKCQIRSNTLGENHHAGTCKMGPVGDKTAVVNPQLQVHGIENLRVIDASIMPTPINCNTIAPVIMFAEKGADMILKKWEHFCNSP